MKIRLVPILVSFCGSLGLATAMTYFVGIYLAFLPQWHRWAEFFVPRALLFVPIPYILLLLYLGLRTYLGQWYLEQGDVEAAIRYTSSRLRPHLLRGRREVDFHRLVLARALIRRQDYAAAREICERGPLAGGGRNALAFARWAMEIALREDDAERARDTFERHSERMRSARSADRRTRASLLACRAELALREDDREGYKALITEALWADPDNTRAMLTRVLGMLTYGQEASDWPEVLRNLELVQGVACTDIPGRAAELAALQALMLYKSGREDEARATLERAATLDADAWSQRVRASIEALFASTGPALESQARPNPQTA